MAAVTITVRLCKQCLSPNAQLLPSAASPYLLHFPKLKVVSSQLQLKDKRARPGNPQSNVPPATPLCNDTVTLLTILFLSTLLFFSLQFR